MTRPARVPVDLGGRSYDVHVGEGAIAAALTDTIGRCDPGRVALVADGAVLPLHGERVRDAFLSAWQEWEMLLALLFKKPFLTVPLRKVKLSKR